METSVVGIDGEVEKGSEEPKDIGVQNKSRTKQTV